MTHSQALWQDARESLKRLICAHRTMYNGIALGPTPSTSATTPAILIENTTGGTVLDQTMVAYISHGASGYGAFPGQGGSNRINSGSTDADMQNNANTSYGANKASWAFCMSWSPSPCVNGPAGGA